MKPLWSDEDERLLQNTLECLKNGWKKLPTNFLKYESWLKSLKDRIGCGFICTTKEQDSTDKPEPKFKVGDWIFSSILGTAHIIGISVTNSEYLLEHTGGIKESTSIKYVNISRQFGKLNNIYKFIASPDDVLKLRKSIRINALRTGDWKEHIDEFMNTWILNRHFLLNLREDYRHVTVENLKTRNEVVDYLASRFVYIGSSGCLVCNGETFVNPQTDQFIHYHRGIEHSCVRYENKTYMNDLIIRPDGKVFDYWDWKVELDEETIKNIK